MDHNTIKFSVPVDNSAEMKQILTEVYRSLTEKGYNPINQIVGYLLSEDPTYITNHNNARSLICKLDRDGRRKSARFECGACGKRSRLQ